MYPHEELTALAAQKAALRQAILARRSECAAAAARVFSPVAWLDRTIARLRRLAPLASLAVIPVGLLLGRLVAPRGRGIRSAVRWAPLVAGAVRSVVAFRDLQRRG